MTASALGSPLLLVGDIVDGIDADRWTRAMVEAGWTGSVEVHVHPGRTGDLPIEGGNHEPLDAVYALGRTGTVGPEVVVVGFGRSGPPVQMLGLARRAAAVVLVDGLGGPFVDPVDQISSTLSMVRAALIGEAGHRAPQPGEVDPRLAHGLTPHGDHPTAARLLTAMPVPLLVIESDASPVPRTIASSLVKGAPQVVLVRVERPEPDPVAAALVRWISS